MAQRLKFSFPSPKAVLRTFENLDDKTAIKVNSDSALLQVIFGPCGPYAFTIPMQLRGL